MIKLALQQLLQNKKRTLITILGIVISVAMITAVAGFVVSTREMMRQTYIAHNGDSHATIFPVTPEQIAAIAADERVESSYTRESEREDRQGTAIFFRIKNVDRNYEKVTEQIAADHQVEAEIFDYNKELLAVEGVIANDRSLMTLYAIGGILGLIIIVGSVIVIANAFEISASERIRQFGLLKSVGATKQQIRRLVVTEGLVLSVIAIPVGIIVGLLVELVALTIANQLLYDVSQLNKGTLYLRFIISGAAIALSAGLSLLTIFLSAWFPARKAAKISAIEAISLTNDVKIKPNEVKASPLVGRIFGFEGILAVKTLRRSRRKYRATVISLVVSMVLFIIGSGFGIMIKQSTDIIYRDFGINVIMYYRELNDEAVNKLTQQLAQLPGKMNSSRYLPAKTKLPAEMISKKAVKYLGSETPYLEDETGINLQLIAVDDEDFAEILSSANVDGTALENSDLPQGILVNFDVSAGNSQRNMFQPFNFISGEQLSFSQKNSDQEEQIELIGEITDTPTSIAPYVATGRVNIVISQQTFSELNQGKLIPEAYWVVQTENSAAYVELAKPIFEAMKAELAGFSPDGKFAVVDYAQNASITKSINLLMQIFIYGFLAMMTLIAITSVLGTISTNINLRLPEFAMLISVGMTAAGLKKMLNLESLFYGLKALMIGLPISIGLYWLMYKAFGLSVGFAFIWPWQSILISMAAIMLITFITMNYSARVLKDKNIIELIRMMNI